MKRMLLTCIFLLVPCSRVSPKQPRKKVSFLVYIAGRNDLQPFINRNISEMKVNGSTQYMNVCVHIEDNNGSRRYYIEKNRVISANMEHPRPVPKADSGSSATPIRAFEWMVNNYPADEYGIIFWDHGYGSLGPAYLRGLRATTLLASAQMEQGLLGPLDLDLFMTSTSIPIYKAVCFDDHYKTALTCERLQQTLATICNNILGGRKLIFIGFDACMMADAAIAHLVKPYAQLMVASQQVEPGNGWQYANAFSIFQHSLPDYRALGRHLVLAYQHAYQHVMGDFTLSAIDLNAMEPVMQNIDRVAALLIRAFRIQRGKSVKEVLAVSKSRYACTHFHEPAFIDLIHFYSNLLKNIPRIAFTNVTEGKEIATSLQMELEKGIALLKNATIANAAGKKLASANGLSIYFPEGPIHPSFKNNSFARSNRWIQLLEWYRNA